MKAYDAQLQASLGGRGHRVTDQRRLILEVVRATDAHPSAEWVYRKVRRRLPRISLGTVYRNLKLLAQEGLIKELGGKGLGRYDGNTDGHYHFSCHSCGRIYDLGEPVERALERRVAARTGFSVTQHRIEFYGLCSACAGSGGHSAKAPSGRHP